MQTDHNEGIYLRYAGSPKRVLLNVTFLHISYSETTKPWFRECDAFREVSFIGHYYTESNVLVADKEKTNYKKMKKKNTTYISSYSDQRGPLKAFSALYWL